MRTICFMTFMFTIQSLAAQEGAFYQAQGGPDKPSTGKDSRERAVEMTFEAIKAMNYEAPGEAAYGGELDWVVIQAPAWRTDEQVDVLSPFVITRVVHGGVLTALETTILTRALQAMAELPPTPKTSAVRRCLREFYARGYAVDDLTVLAQRKAICELIHPWCGTEPDPVPFGQSTVAKRFERRERHLREIGAPASPVPAPSKPANSF